MNGGVLAAAGFGIIPGLLDLDRHTEIADGLDDIFDQVGDCVGGPTCHPALHLAKTACEDGPAALGLLHEEIDIFLERAVGGQLLLDFLHHDGDRRQWRSQLMRDGSGNAIELGEMLSRASTSSVADRASASRRASVETREA